MLGVTLGNIYTGMSQLCHFTLKSKVSSMKQRVFNLVQYATFRVNFTVEFIQLKIQLKYAFKMYHGK